MPMINDFKVLLDSLSGIQKAGYTTVPEKYVPPYIVLTTISSPRTFDHDGPTLTVTSRIQVDVYATDYKATKEIAIKLYALQTQNSIKISKIELANEAEGYETETKLYRISLDFKVDHYETTGGN